MSSAEAEERFRQIFFAHLDSEGHTEDDAYRLIFKTPRSFHGAPSDADWADFVKHISAAKAPKVAAGKTFLGMELEAKPRSFRRPRPVLHHGIIPDAYLNDFASPLGPKDSAPRPRTTTFPCAPATTTRCPARTPRSTTLRCPISAPRLGAPAWRATAVVLGLVTAAVTGGSLVLTYHAATIGQLVEKTSGVVLMTAGVLGGGLFWGWLRERTGSVWPPLLSHGGAVVAYLAVHFWLTRGGG